MKVDKKNHPIELDGSQGEGGGQILRSALTLSMITGTPFHISNIRARRRKPGLLRQHLTAVTAAAEICDAELDGAVPGAMEMSFTPGPIRGGNYRYAIGTAGSCTLVLQTVLPALWFADAPSTISVTGGTHNKAAPPADFLIEAWLPLIRRMGVDMDIRLTRHGFYPAGGGSVAADVRPAAELLPLSLETRGELSAAEAKIIFAGLPFGIAKRELDTLTSQMTFDNTAIYELPADEGPGNAVMLMLRHREVCEVLTGFAEKGVSAESVARRTVRAAQRYLQNEAAVGDYLADQLVLPMALAGGGALTTAVLSPHLQSNMEVISKFLPVDFNICQKETCWRIAVT